MAGISTISYCTDQDIFDIYPRISQYDYKIELPRKWSKSGHTYTLNDFKFLGDEYGLVGSDRIIQLYANGEDLGSPKEDPAGVNITGEWFMNLGIPRIIYYDDTASPNDIVMELGEDRTNLTQRFRRKASRIIESYLGSTISREIMKDREGNYPTSIIQATALKSAILFISAHDPINSDLIPLNAEYDDIMGKIRSGKIVMTGHRSEDDSKGTIREVVVMEIPSFFENTLGRIRPVELRGNYSGSEYELLKLRFLTGSGLLAVGAGAEFSVWGKTSTNLKQKLLVDGKAINGDYQSLGLGNLEIRFGGKYTTPGVIDGQLFASVAVGGDEWEIELWGNNIQPTVPQIDSTTLVRSGLWH